MNVQTGFTKYLSLPSGIFIDGKYAASAAGQTFETTAPFNGDTIAILPSCDACDVDAAVWVSFSNMISSILISLGSPSLRTVFAVDAVFSTIWSNVEIRAGASLRCIGL